MNKQNVVHTNNVVFNFKKKILMCATWKKLEGVMLNEISQSQEDKHCMNLLP